MPRSSFKSNTEPRRLIEKSLVRKRLVLNDKSLDQNAARCGHGNTGAPPWHICQRQRKLCVNASILHECFLAEQTQNRNPTHMTRTASLPTHFSILNPGTPCAEPHYLLQNSAKQSLSRNAAANPWMGNVANKSQLWFPFSGQTQFAQIIGSQLVFTVGCYK